MSMTNKSFFSPFIHYLIYFFSAIIFSFFLDIGALDDGLRHLSFASDNEIMKSWGDVFPYSLFGEYDPWFGWHFILEKFLIFFSKYQTQIIINTISLFFMMIFIHKFLFEYIEYRLDSLGYVIVLIITLLTSYRYVMIRPDMLSGFYIMAMILLRNKFINTFILTIIYGPLYYLFFLYTGSIGLVYLIQKKWKAFLGVFVGTIFSFFFFLIHDFDGYTNTVYNILIDQKLRMGLEVLEGRPIFDFLINLNYFILLPIFLIGSFLLIYKNHGYFKSNTLATFLLITSILWVNQYRYYHLFLPIIFVYILSIVFNSRKKQIFYILRKYLVLLKKFFSFSKGKKLFYLVAIPYSVLMLGYIYSNQSMTKRVEIGEEYQDKKYNNKLILSNAMNPDMFIMLYFNPSIKTIPSCSIGWFNSEKKELKEIYVEMISSKGTSEENLKKLINSVKADYYFHYTNITNKVLDLEKLRNFGIIPMEIRKNKIVFKVKK